MFLLDEETLSKVWLARRMTAMLAANSANPEATERLLNSLGRTHDNVEFLASLKPSSAAS
jgi:transcription termination factor Rho